MSKYGAKRTTVDGITFASKREAKRYCELKLLEKAGEIKHLTTQTPYALDVREIRLGKYFADFQYFDVQHKAWIVEDAKGFRTPLYRWKKKHVEAQYGIVITEV